MQESGSQAEPGGSPAQEPDQAEGGTAAPKAYDFRTGTELSRDSFYQLRFHCERLTNVLGRIVGAYLDIAADVEITSVEPATFEQYTEGLTDLSAAGLVQIAEHLPELIWQIDSSLTGVIIGRMLGGPGGALDRPPTQLEASLLSRFIQELVDVWATIWERLSEHNPTVTEVVVDLTELQARAGDEQVVRLLMQVRLGEELGNLRDLCVTSASPATFGTIIA